MKDVLLREVLPEDLNIFFENQRDPVAIEMVGFIYRDPNNRKLFDEHWGRILANESNINRTIVFQGQVAGNIASFLMDGKREIGYWIGKEFWGQGIATQALNEYLQLVSKRPLFAHVAQANEGSIRVLRKCGFLPIKMHKSHCSYLKKDISEIILSLK